MDVIEQIAGSVIILEPRGRIDSATAKEFAVASHLLRGGPAQIEQGLWQLNPLFNDNPDHPEVALSTAEAVGAQLLLGVYPKDIQKSMIANGLEWIDRIAPKVPGYWRVPMVRALLQYCDGSLDEAGKEFDKALALDRQSTISRGWYTQYLFAIGRQEEGLRHVRLTAGDSVDNAQIQALHGVYLCKAGRFEEAQRALAQSLTLDRNCWAAHWGSALLNVSTGDQERAMEHVKRFQELVEPEEYQNIIRMLELKHSDS